MCWSITSFCNKLWQRSHMTRIRDKQSTMHSRPLKSKVVVVPKRQIFGWGRISLWAMLHSAATILGVNVASQMPTPASLALLPRWLDPWELAHMTFITGLLIVAPIPWLYRHTPGWRILAFAVVYVLGLVVWGEVVLLLLVEWQLRIPVLYRPGMSRLSFAASNLLVGGFVVCCLMWLICRVVRGPIVQQDGTLCPNCAYLLVGCAGRICPECGREFTYQELGTTPEHLAVLASQREEEEIEGESAAG